MRVRMLETRRGSEDGIHNRIYEAGKVYDVVPTLAEMWLKSRRCEEDKSLDGPSETKVMEPEKKPEKKIFGTRKKAR